MFETIVRSTYKDAPDITLLNVAVDSVDGSRLLYQYSVPSTAPDHYAYWHHVQLDFSRPGKPVVDSVCGTLNGTPRRECLSQQWFALLDEAETILAAWPHEYNNRGPRRVWGWTPQPGTQGLGTTTTEVASVQTNAASGSASERGADLGRAHSLIGFAPRRTLHDVIGDILCESNA